MSYEKLLEWALQKPMKTRNFLCIGVDYGSGVPRSQHFSADAGFLQISTKLIVHHQIELIAKSILAQIVITELENHGFHWDMPDDVEFQDVVFLHICVW